MEWLRIGELARRTGLTQRALRHYDEIGLLVPEETDPWTGYRRYAAAQLMTANRITALRGLGFSLAETAALLACCTDSGTATATGAACAVCALRHSFITELAAFMSTRAARPCPIVLTTSADGFAAAITARIRSASPTPEAADQQESADRQAQPQQAAPAAAPAASTPVNKKENGFWGNTITVINNIADYISKEGVNILCMQEYKPHDMYSEEEVRGAFGFFNYLAIRESSMSRIGLIIYSKFFFKF